MVTGKYSITFTDEKAPKINCKYSEVNREIIFTPDVEVSDSYSVELVIVKPDNTFTISTGVISDTGEITVTIPSQATVVKGVGQYLIRIFDNTTNIYSAYGDIWIDDNLLTDDVIDSVAEVNGNIFPDDFALKSEIPSVDSLIDDDTTAIDKTWSSDKIADEIAGATPSPSTYIDDNEVLYDKTWSSEKISYELGQITGLDIYSTTEQPVGKWTDGRMVYERTFITTALSTGSWTNFSVTIPNFDFMVKLDYTIVYNAYMMGNAYWESTNYHASAFMRDYGTNDWRIQYYVPNLSGGRFAIFVVRYVKSV